ncbi:MAG: hypothetical protein R2854_21170 [Caldilineaceae bacterium]
MVGITLGISNVRADVRPGAGQLERDANLCVRVIAEVKEDVGDLAPALGHVGHFLLHRGIAVQKTHPQRSARCPFLEGLNCAGVLVKQIRVTTVQGVLFQRLEHGLLLQRLIQRHHRTDLHRFGHGSPPPAIQRVTSRKS